MNSQILAFSKQLNLINEIIETALNLFNHYSHHTPPSKAVPLVALLIAIKARGTQKQLPKLTELQAWIGQTISRQQLFKLELDILHAVDFRVLKCTVAELLDSHQRDGIFLEGDKYVSRDEVCMEDKSKRVQEMERLIQRCRKLIQKKSKPSGKTIPEAKQFMQDLYEKALEQNMQIEFPEELAGAIVFLGRKKLVRGCPWPAELQHRTGLSLNHISPMVHKLQAII